MLGTVGAMSVALSPAAVTLGMSLDLVDAGVRDRAVDRFRDNGIRLPTLAQLADPSTMPADAVAALDGVDRDGPDPRNLFRVHWYNDRSGGRVDVPEHIELPSELTGVDALF